MEHLSIKEIYDRLEELKDWEMVGHEITKEFNFKSFKEAIEFVQKVGEEAEREHHSPDILIRHNKVIITLTTPSASGLTYKDFKLARIIEQLV
ncbi:4a-hydroxytetrahydrobiopterin dehydratase [Candidatus Woesearchaeota archaeon]|nr:4a-hydroxytetrahydrobiopterin dehydratase [Candidatus Woesearchaeota archaeon]